MPFQGELLSGRDSSLKEDTAGLQKRNEIVRSFLKPEAYNGCLLQV
jgi:hypothetical protein